MRKLNEQWIENGRMPACPFCKGYPELESEENWEGETFGLSSVLSAGQGQPNTLKSRSCRRLEQED